MYLKKINIYDYFAINFNYAFVVYRDRHRTAAKQ